MSTRIMLAVLTAVTAVSTAGAQTYTFTQTELGRIVPARFVTTTQAMMADVDVAAPTTTPAAASSVESGVRVEIPSDEISTWNAVSAIDADGDVEKDKDDAGFFGSTTGRVSIVGLAGLAGASYFALRGDQPSPVSQQALFDTETLPAFSENPEPATIVLMATGLLGIGIVARRRRAN